MLVRMVWWRGKLTMLEKEGRITVAMSLKGGWELCTGGCLRKEHRHFSNSRVVETEGCFRPRISKNKVSDVTILRPLYFTCISMLNSWLLQQRVNKRGETSAKGRWRLHKQKKQVPSPLPMSFGSGYFPGTAGQPEGRPKSAVMTQPWRSGHHQGRSAPISALAQVVTTHQGPKPGLSQLPCLFP